MKNRRTFFKINVKNKKLRTNWNFYDKLIFIKTETKIIYYNNDIKYNNIPIVILLLLNYRFFSIKCNTLSSSNNQGVAKVDTDLLCACENDKLVTLDGVVAMRDSMKSYAFKRVVCPEPSIKKC